MKVLKSLLILMFPLFCLGQCGNSGNTTEARLHLSLQNTIEMSGATGGKLFFDKILVNGEIKEDYLPVKNDNIQNIKL